MTTHTVAPGTMAQALAAALPATTTTTTFAGFDLISYIEEMLLDGELKARVVSSLAWSLDMKCINAARAIFFRTYNESLETGTIDAFNDFVNAMSEVRQNSAHLTEIGFDKSDAFGDLVELLNMRKFWHDRASAVATRVYEPKSLMAQVYAEKLREPSALDRSKLGMRAKFMAGDDAELEAKLMANLLNMSAEGLARQHELRQKTRPAIVRILDEAANRSVIQYDGEAPEFGTLSTEMQRSFIESAMASIDRALNDLASARQVTVDDYAVACRDGILLQRQLKAVLASPRMTIREVSKRDSSV